VKRLIIQIAVTLMIPGLAGCVHSVHNDMVRLCNAETTPSNDTRLDEIMAETTDQEMKRLSKVIWVQEEEIKNRKVRAMLEEVTRADYDKKLEPIRRMVKEAGLKNCPVIEEGGILWEVLNHPSINGSID